MSPNFAWSTAASWFGFGKQNKELCTSSQACNYAWHEAAASPRGHPDPGFNSSPGKKPTVPSVATATDAGKVPEEAKH